MFSSRAAFTSTAPCKSEIEDLLVPFQDPTCVSFLCFSNKTLWRVNQCGYGSKPLTPTIRCATNQTKRPPMLKLIKTRIDRNAFDPQRVHSRSCSNGDRKPKPAPYKKLYWHIINRLVYNWNRLQGYYCLDNWGVKSLVTIVSHLLSSRIMIMLAFFSELL